MYGALLLLSSIACFPRLDISEQGPDGADAGGEGSTGGASDGGGSGDDDDDDTNASPPELTSVDPEHGSNAGGLTVELSGSNFTDDARVWFGDKEAEVVRVRPSSIEVELAADTSTTGAVSLRIETAAGEATLDNGFTLWDDASGRAITLLRTRVIDGWDSSGGWTDFQGAVWNINAEDVWSTDSQAALGQCSPIITTEGALSRPTKVSIAGPLGTAHFTHEAGSEILTYEATSPDVDGMTGEQFDVESEGGAWPNYEVSDGLRFPDALILDTPDPFSFQTYDGEEFTIAWEAWTADRIVLALFDGESDDALVCSMENSGAFTVPMEEFESFTPTEYEWWGRAYLVQIAVIAYRDTAVPVDFNNGELRAQGGIGYATWARVEVPWL